MFLYVYIHLFIFSFLLLSYFCIQNSNNPVIDFKKILHHVQAKQFMTAIYDQE